MKRIFAIVISLAAAGMIVAPASVGAVTVAKLQAQIDALSSCGRQRRGARGRNIPLL